MAIGGIGTHIVGGIGGKTRYAASETPSARAVGGVAVVYSRVLARAPAHASRRHCGTPAVGHVATTGGRRLGNVRHRVGGHGRHGHILCGGEAHLVAVGRTNAVLRIGAHIIGRVGGQASHVAGIVSRARAVAGMAATGCGVVGCAPADAALGHVGTTRGRHIAAARGCSLGDICHLGCRHCWHVGRGAEAHFAAIACALAVLGVGAHIVDGACRQTCHVAGVCACARAARGMAAGGGRVVACAPADAALGNCGSAVGGHVAAALG